MLDTAIDDAAAARRMMVDCQIRTADVTNPDVLESMLAVPRELFVPPQRAGQAYSDYAITLGEGRALLTPMVLAKLIQSALVGSTDHVLDVGCGTGYAAAVLARIAGSVVALEENSSLARDAQAALAKAGAANVTVVTGPLASGWAASAPYDVILLDGATEIVPEALGAQLKPGGRLTCVFGGGPTGKAMIYRLIEGRLVGRQVFDAAAPVLPGYVAPKTFVF
ncbi:MAG TPA: protein-L-isoaspartate O-methyltransferase [Xanthobacteraceae bacterium]|jgi:protein-L-isoaspartate(D-aspartate) O-methyltransferase|nr:protein-L-isoaspartate O-methyltransferase [Xanthobacteraceae bacterium]